MNIKKHIYLALIGFLSIILLTGCSGYGTLRYHSESGENISIEDLIANSNNYHIYYSGYAENNSSGIMFDPKNDTKTLSPSRRWIKIEGRERVSEVVSWIMIYDNPGNAPALRSIHGPGGQLYGYLFTGWYHAVFKVVDEKTLFAYDLPQPPHYYYGPSEREIGRNN